LVSTINSLFKQFLLNGLGESLWKLIAEPTLQSQLFAALLVSAKETLQLEASDGYIPSTQLKFFGFREST